MEVNCGRRFFIFLFLGILAWRSNEASVAINGVGVVGIVMNFFCFSKRLILWSVWREAKF